MALLDAKNIRIPRLGGFFEAPLGTPWPTDTATPLSAAWKGWGYLGPDGIGEDYSFTEEDGKVWQDNETAYTINTDGTYELTVPAIETRKEIIETIYETVVDPTSGLYVIDPNATHSRKQFCAEFIDKRTMKKQRKFGVFSVKSGVSFSNSATEATILTPTLRVFGPITVIDDLLATEAPVEG